MFVRNSSGAGSRRCARRVCPSFLLEGLENRRLLATVSISDGAAPEFEENTPHTLSLLVRLDKAIGQDVVVGFATADASATSPDDYMAMDSTVTIPAGSTSAHIEIQLVADSIVERDETFTVRLTGVESGNAQIGRATATATIKNSDFPFIYIDDATLTEGSGGTTDAVFQISVSEPPVVPASFSFRTLTGTAQAVVDYVNTFGTVDLAVGQTSATVTVPVVADPMIEPDENFYVELGGPENAAFSRNVAVATILNDDTKPTPPQPAMPALRQPKANAQIYKFTVIYSDDGAVNVRTLDKKDIVVTGPRRYKQTARLIKTTPRANAARIDAVYQITAPGGRWDRSDRGNYTFWLQNRQVSDTGGNYTPRTKVGVLSARMGGRARAARTAGRLARVAAPASLAPMTRFAASIRIDDVSDPLMPQDSAVWQ